MRVVAAADINKDGFTKIMEIENAFSEPISIVIASEEDRLSKFHLIEGGTEIAIVQNKTAEIPVEITKTIYNLDDGKFNPKTPMDF